MGPNPHNTRRTYQMSKLGGQKEIHQQSCWTNHQRPDQKDQSAFGFKDTVVFLGAILGIKIRPEATVDGADRSSDNQGNEYQRLNSRRHIVRRGLKDRGGGIDDGQETRDCNTKYERGIRDGGIKDERPAADKEREKADFFTIRMDAG